jgi:phosphatidylserine/phosphatidylglycerophosphate/cardiolipin synthase-like enzyme
VTGAFLSSLGTESALLRAQAAEASRHATQSGGYMADALALANNDVVQVVWRYDHPITGCLGFEVSRQEGGVTPNGNWTALPAWVGFKGQKNPAWTAKTTTEWPIQKFEWKDLTAIRGKTYGYRVVPMAGQPDKLQPLRAQALYTKNTVTLTPKRGSFSTYFNRGILSTQFLSHQLKPGPSGAPNYRTLKDRIDQPDDPLRKALAGQIIEGVESLLQRAQTEGGTCYAALYELDDPELLKRLLNMGDHLHLILSNTGSDDATNHSARQTLHDAGLDVMDRFLPSGHIGHNKFVVYLAPDNTPKAVLLGSTNWTDTGLCAQSNNALVVESSDLARAYLSYWDRLKTDQKQGPDLRKADGLPGKQTAIDGAQSIVWFSPNTVKARVRDKKGRPKKVEATPPDLTEVFALMKAAKRAILFLVFQPGMPSIVQQAAEIGKARPDLFIRGAATDPNAVGSFDAILIHRAGQDPDRVVAASAINDQFAFWQKELLKSGPKAHAIVHSKIVVIDPLAPGCVVITGSHNLGYQASYNNDENLLIVKGQSELARAYAVNVMDVYDHYRFRYIVNQRNTKAFAGLEPSDEWQKKYFDPKSQASQDYKAWF